ncbi:MAG: hypothetical protein JOZ19_02750 [Rubrobacter sp.]|nr:hypothetical protein [Rubrobacter sp.]
MAKVYSAALIASDQLVVQLPLSTEVEASITRCAIIIATILSVDDKR